MCATNSIKDTEVSVVDGQQKCFFKFYFSNPRCNFNDIHTSYGFGIMLMCIHRKLALRSKRSIFVTPFQKFTNVVILCYYFLLKSATDAFNVITCICWFLCLIFTMTGRKTKKTDKYCENNSTFPLI